MEAPFGEWNLLEVIASGDEVAIWLNGMLVRRASTVIPRSGHIGFQTEFASYEIRRAEVRSVPADSLDESE